MNESIAEICSKVPQDVEWVCIRSLSTQKSPFENTFLPLIYINSFLKVVATPILAYGFYLAAFCSSHLQGRVKYHVLNFQMIGAFSDIYFFFISEPRPYFPLLMVEFRGLAQAWFGIHPFIIVVGQVISISLLPASIFQAIYFKLQILLTPGHPLKLSFRARLLILVLFYHGCLCVHLPFVYFLFINTQQAKGKLSALYPFIADIINRPETLALTWTDDPWAQAWMYVILLMICGFLLGATFAAVSTWYYVELRITSQRTKELERKVLVILFIHCFSPFAIMLPAYFGCYLIVYMDLWFCQDLIDLLVGTVSTYGTWSTITMILISGPYREMTYRLFTQAIVPRPHYNWTGQGLRRRSTVVPFVTEIPRRTVSISHIR